MDITGNVEGNIKDLKYLIFWLRGMDGVVKLNTKTIF